MTPQELLNEFYKMPSVEQKEVLDSLSESASDAQAEDLRIQKALFEARLLREIRLSRSGKVAEFKPIEVEGEPVSETIIRERR